MKVLLAGPGTGKTTNIKRIISNHGGGSRFLILSFTNATVDDLLKSLNQEGVTAKNCMTLHKFTIKYNHEGSRHVLLSPEEDVLKKIVKSKDISIEFSEMCNFLNCSTFDQMIARFVSFAKSNPTYLRDKLSDYDALIVDEYQDFNPAEQEIIDILIGIVGTSYVLGDDDQCIYDFKDTSSDKLISMYEDSGNEKIDHEHICYRCPDKVVEHATNLILSNKNRVSKTWRKSGKQGDIDYFQLSTFKDVANEIVQQLVHMTDCSVLILSPVKFAIHPLVDLLNHHNMDHANYFSVKFPLELLKRTWEVRSIFGNYKYLNLILSGYSFLKNRKKFYLLLNKHFEDGQDYEAMYDLLKNYMPKEMCCNKTSLDDFLSQPEYKGVYELFNQAIGNSPEERLENLFNKPSEIEDKNIKIMSIHKSKGLQADYVFMIGLVEGIIPNKKTGNDTIESQRRLFYVGMTRAKRKLILYSNIEIDGKYANKVNKSEFQYDHRRKVYRGKASAFIEELKL